MQCKLIYRERKWINGYMKMEWEWWMGGICKEQETLRVDGYIHYLNCGDGFMSVCVFQALSNYALKTCTLLYHLYVNKAEKT